MFCLRGEGVFGLGGKIYSCQPGMLFVIDPEVLHDDHYPEIADGLEHLWLRPLGDRVFVSWIHIQNGLIRPMSDQVFAFGQEELGLCPSHFVADADDAPPPYRVARFRLLGGAIGLAMLQRIGSDYKGEDDQEKDLPERVVEAICRHIDRTAGKDITLDFLAHFSGYSKYHLHRIFREQTGHTIHQYIDFARQKKVLELQDEGVGSSAIAEELGFSCKASFLRWRRRYMQKERPGGSKSRRAS